MTNFTEKLTVVTLNSKHGFPFPIAGELQSRQLSFDSSVWTVKLTRSGISVNLFWQTSTQQKSKKKIKKKKNNKKTLVSNVKDSSVVLSPGLL